MTKDQLDAIEAWIVTIIKDEDRASDLADSRHRFEARKDVELAFDSWEPGND